MFAMVDALPQHTPDGPAPRLHVTLNEVEVLGDLPIYRGMARNVLSILDELDHKGRGQDISRAMLHETHVTGLQASFLSYLTTCHSRRP